MHHGAVVHTDTRYRPTQPIMVAGNRFALPEHGPHRTEGPAIETVDGDPEWWLCGHPLDEPRARDLDARPAALRVFAGLVAGHPPSGTRTRELADAALRLAGT